MAPSFANFSPSALSLLRRGEQPTRPQSSTARNPSAKPRFANMTSPAPPRAPPPRELLVLAHGLQGMVDDFKYLLESLHSTPAARDGSLLVHASPVNQHKTHDGITLGGLRLAEDVQNVVAEHATLETISLVGFSLGGLYVRYAIAHLYNPADGRIAGLQASKVVMVASPNLGVRQFGVYRFIPRGIREVAKQLVLGESTREVLLLDDEMLLERMTRDDDAPFMKALRTFDTRILYANVRQDFMVNYGTAALDTRMKGLNAEDVLREMRHEAVDSDYDDRGCKIAFEFSIRERDHGQQPQTGKGNGTGTGEACVEEVMADRLRSVGWKVVGVDFPVGLPITHNRIVAMSRNLIHTWMNMSGRRAVHHLVDTVSRDFEQHNRQFRAVT